MPHIKSITEPLLKLNSELTDKERIAILHSKLNKLEKRNDELACTIRNQNRHISELKAKIAEDDLQYPSTLNGCTMVSVKAYFKLREVCKKLEQRIWEIAQELNKQN